MVKLQGTAPNQVPTNADLGSLAYADHDNVNLTAADLKLKALSKTKSQTAVDVFIYDTSKDSDGGAWRKRTQHTSWYNEGASSTRGSRAEFPAVAVIVAEATKVTIYDADDPSLPMWMVFNEGTGNAFWSNGTIYPTGVAMLNGIMFVGQGGAHAAGLNRMDFLRDTTSLMIETTVKYNVMTIADRNRGGITTIDGTFTAGLVNRQVNDVAMTVLPDAPTDPATGLEIPTIAVATNGGVSVIKDDGTVADITCANGSFTISTLVDFKGGQLWMNQGNGASVDSIFVFNTPPSADTALTLNSKSGTGANADAYYKEHPTLGDLHFVGNSSTDLNNAVSQGSVGSNDGLNLIAEDPTTPANGMVAYTTSTYATGWMPGDIKLAALADTTAETLSGSDLITNGNMEQTSGWEEYNQPGSSGRSTVQVHSGTYSWAFTSDGNYDGIITNTHFSLVAGKQYVVNAWVYPVNDTGIGVRLNNGAAGSAGFVDASGLTQGAWNEISVTLTADTTTSTGTLGFDTDVLYSTGTWYIDDVSMRLADPDRSVNGNGLAVHGSITKAAVATGADVVAYSGFSSSNYLEQPYNPDLNFGANDDFCVMGWAKRSGNLIAIVSVGDGGSDDFTVQYNNGFNAGYLGGSFTSAISYASGEWGFVCARRTGGNLYVSVNGGAEQSMSDSIDWSSKWTNPQLRIGIRSPLTNPWSGSLALLRISATAPTADQIAKIYEDEKVLFQENAKATLTGSSDAVTALAHDPDTDLLHVGTSGGRSVFQGLRRVEEHTGTDNQSLAAISAVDGLVVEGK